MRSLNKSKDKGALFIDEEAWNDFGRMIKIQVQNVNFITVRSK